MKRINGLFPLLLILVFGACQSQQSANMPAGLSPKLQTLVNEAVFEVVILKPEEKNIVYDRELDWSIIPYAIRSDKYYSIGTAFAISSAEAVTAYHVIDLSDESEVVSEYFIRDSKGNVFEIDMVHKVSNEKDFLVFTVKNKTFSSWFELNPSFKTNSQVYSIGNALGEGIVVRNGLILGTVPEDEEGRWDLLKSSADGNPGNSGGPLVTPDGKVVGIVIALRDNILYSLPVSEVISAPSNTTHFRRKYSYGHLLFSKRIYRVFEMDTALPAAYKDFRRTIYEGYKAYYPTAMTDLFNEMPQYLDGPNNRYLLYQVVRSDFPELAFVDKNDDQWKVSDLRIQNFNLPDDGLLLQSDVSDFLFIKIRRPKSIPVEKINTDPKTIMDTYLQAVNLERTLGSAGNKYRILSFGDPVKISEYADRQGRRWIKTYWLIDFSDEIMIAYILPAPNGPLVMMTRQDSYSRHVYEWDMEATCDRLFAGYRGNLEEWTEFLAMKKWVPEFLSSFAFNWNERDKSISLALPQLTLKAGEPVFTWTSQSSFLLVPGYYRKGEKIEYGFRSLVVERDIKGSDYFVVHQHVKPDERLGTKVMENWNEVVTAKYPFDGVSRISSNDNTGSAGGLLSRMNLSDDVRYSLYLNMENPGDEESLSGRFKILEGNISIIK
ncbi:MAG: serine protease [Treponema sp.]|nr:serine protease [Treponema sp.]